MDHQNIPLKKQKSREFSGSPENLGLANGPGSIPGQGTKILQNAWPKKKNFFFFKENEKATDSGNIICKTDYLTKELYATF